jgi:WD40 repeat protein
MPDAELLKKCNAAKADWDKAACYEYSKTTWGDTIVEPIHTKTLKGHSKKVYGMKFANSEEAGMTEKLATCGQEGLVFLWDVAKGTKCMAPIKHNFVRTVAVTSDCKRLACGGMDNAITLYDLADPMNPTKIKTFGQDDHDGYLSDLTFRPNDDTKMVSASGDTTAIYWDVNKAKPIHFFKGHTADVNTASIGRDQPKLVATASGDNSLRVWDVDTGKCIRRCEVDGECNAVAMFPNGGAVSFCNDNGKFGVFDVGSNSIIETVQHKQQGARLMCISMSRSGRYFYMGMTTGQITVSSTFKPAKWRTVKAHEQYTCSMAVPGDGCCLASGAYDNLVKVYQAPSPK